MSLKNLENGWKQFGNGKKWRIKAPKYLCEIDEANNTPNYANISSTKSKVQKVKSFYSGKLTLGNLNEFGTALDIITANSFTESLGTVPTPFSYLSLKEKFDNSTGINTGVKLDTLLNYITNTPGGKFLVRKEPGYVNPIQSPSRVSVGAHHMLISTALDILKTSSSKKESAIIDLVLRLPAESVYAANLAIQYLNKYNSKHFNQPPLIAATYNAGSLRLTSKNSWNLVQYGEHIDRWVAYYNTSILCG
ncbi:MAG: hypothetical protein POELPBGB_01335 [Bacteroidia bacterium]|nr:hypothetical protein [Bacteroidia bacterium]